MKFQDTASLELTQLFTITVNDLTEVDFSFDSTSVNENTAGAVGQATATNFDTFATFALQAGAGDMHNSAFSLTAQGALTINSAADYEMRSEYSIRVEVTDASSTFQKIFIITVNDQPDPNDITFDSLSVNENAANAAVGTATTAGGSGGDTYTYSLVSGDGDTDNASFSFSGAQLQIGATAADYEVKKTYSIRVQSTDQNGASFQKPFTVSILDQDDPNSITLDNSSVSENASGVVVGQASTSGGTGPYTYTKESGSGDTDNGDFTISSSGSLTLDNAADYEAKKYFSIRVQTVDSNSIAYQQILIIDINDVSEPSDLLLSRSTLN